LRLSDVAAALARHWERLDAQDRGHAAPANKGARRST
jgi:hypothetical protein